MLLLTAPSFCQPPLVSCDKAPSRFRSETISSRGRRAYAVTEAQISKQWGCANTARLYVAARGEPFRLVYTMAPLNSTDTGNSIRPVAWSPDGEWLAVEALYTTHLPTDAAANGLLLYGARTGRVKEVNSDFSNAVSKAERRACDIVLRSVDGFDAAGNVVLELADFVDVDQETRDCAGKDSKWLLNPETGRIRPAGVLSHR